MYKILVDGDIVAFQAAAATDGRMYTVSNGETFKYHKDAKKRAEEIDGEFEISYVPEPMQHALYIVKKKLHDMETHLKELGIEGEMVIYLSSGGSFRNQVHPLYKANRKDVRRPTNLESCKDYLRQHRDAIVRPNEYEADDLIIMEAVEMDSIGVTPIVATIDKDLKQYPCLFYNFNKKTLEDITEYDAMINFYTQLLTGDATDGIVGIKGVGPKTAEKILAPCNTPFECYVAVLGEWLKRSKREDEEGEELYLARMLHTVRIAGRLLWLCRHEGDLWNPPEES